MDPITGAIVAALAAGVAAGATEVGKKVIVDAYEALKAAIKKNYGPDSDVVEAVDNLEQKPDSQARQAVVAEEIADADLTQDPDLVKLAQTLLDALKETPQGQQAVSKYNIQATDSEIGIIGDNAHVEKLQFD